MLNTHIIPLPFYFHVKILEMDIVFDKLVIVHECKFKFQKTLFH